MVKQAVRETYTYYYPDGSVKVVSGAPLAGTGKAWTLGAYHPPLYPSPLNVRVGKAGIKVWMVVNWLQLCEGDRERLLEQYGQVLAPKDVDAAISYYRDNQEAIDERIAEEAESA